MCCPRFNCWIPNCLSTTFVNFLEIESFKYPSWICISDKFHPNQKFSSGWVTSFFSDCILETCNCFTLCSPIHCLTVEITLLLLSALIMSTKSWRSHNLSYSYQRVTAAHSKSFQREQDRVKRPLVIIAVKMKWIKTMNRILFPPSESMTWRRGELGENP